MDIKKAISECYKHQSSEDEIIIILEYKGKSNVACHPDFSEYFCKAVGYRWEDLRVGWKNFRGWHRTSLSAKSLRAE